ncbi:XK-related protein 4-like [Branchiostoma floridae]|uniref:XK-related protein n=2 Tax=Branchiostoma floridae TaxID=7739 RepID=A0A9J7MHW0_BRAFL|nr:XK-related protein 4-like [Branchiostoma floridae]
MLLLPSNADRNGMFQHTCENMASGRANANTMSSSNRQQTPEPHCCGDLKTRYDRFLVWLYEEEFTYIDALFVFVGIVTFLADIVSDVVLAVRNYFLEGYYGWFAMTITFVLLPSIVLQLCSIRWYLQDRSKVPESERAGVLSCLWRGLLHFLQLGTMWRCVQALIYGFRSRRDHQKWYRKWLAEWTDVCLLRMFEAFLESAPQLVLQLYIMQVKGQSDPITVLAVGTSLASLSVALVSYHKSLREALPDADRITYTGVVLWVLWRLCTVTARVVAISLFASQFHWYTFAILGGHFIIMFVWRSCQDIRFYENRVEQTGFNIVIAFVNIFSWLSMVQESRSRYRATAFYALVYVENATMAGLWYWKMQQAGLRPVYLKPALLLVYVGFFVGIIFMSLHYLFCHPKQIPICIRPFDDVDGPNIDEVDGYDSNNKADGTEVNDRCQAKVPTMNFGFTCRWKVTEDDVKNFERRLSRSSTGRCSTDGKRKSCGEKPPPDETIGRAVSVDCGNLRENFYQECESCV